MSNAEHAIVSAESQLPAVPEQPAASPEGMVMPRHVAAVVPPYHHERWSQLTFEQQARVSCLLQIFADMTSAPEGLVAASNRIGRTHPGRGFSGPNLRALYYNFRDAEKREKGTGWLTLAKVYRGPQKLPEQFVQEVRRRMESNSVSIRAAITALRAEWSEGVSIPGYGTWREYWRVTRPLDDVPERYPFGFFPPGWSESNLYSYQSSKAQRTLKILGKAAAKRYLPHVMRSLEGLRFMELIVIDDFECDQMVTAWNPETKRWQNCRCAGLVAIDAASRTKLAIGIKPRFTDEDGKRMSLTRADVQTLLREVFLNFGLPEHGCTILCENAAAAITGDFELALQLLLGVQVARTGIIREKTLRNGFVQSGGKPWEKPWIESMFRLMHSTAGALPGQKGASYALKPADLEAKLLYTEKLLNTEGVTAEIAAQLRVPLMRVDELLTAYEKIFRRMEERHDHKLEGFEERLMQRLPSGDVVDPASLALMPPEQVLECTPVPVKESPAERRARLMSQCRRAKVAEHVLYCLLLTPKRLELRNHRLTFSHQGKGYTFADADSQIMHMQEGTELLGYFDPARPHVLHVTDLKGRYLGRVSSRNRVDIRDHAAISHEAGEVARMIRVCVEQPLLERHAAEDAQLGADREHNDNVLRENKLLPDAPETKQPARAQRASKGEDERPAALSKILRHSPTRDAFKARKLHLDLAKGIAAEVAESDRRAELAREVSRRAEAVTAEELQEFCGGAATPVQTEAPAIAEPRPADPPAPPSDDDEGGLTDLI